MVGDQRSLFKYMSIGQGVQCVGRAADGCVHKPQASCSPIAAIRLGFTFALHYCSLQ